MTRGGEVGGHGAAHVAEAEEQNGGHGVLLVGTGCGGGHEPAGITKLAPSRTPEGQRVVTVFVLV